MTLRSTARRLAIVVALALIALLPALTQAAVIQIAPQAAAPSSQAVTSSRGAAAQTAPAETAGTQPAPTPAAPTQTAPSQAAPPQRAALPQAAGNAAPVSGGPAYDIEIVIFRANVALGQPENWAAETTTGGTVAGGEAASGSGVGKLLTVLPSSDYRLTYLVSKLRSSGTYLPVAHAAWVQSASAWGTHAGFPLQSLGINVPGLTGVVFLERGQFLHLGMTLSYTMQDPPSGLNAPPNTTFVMNETRRVRFYQRNYFDHPAFGVIALVTPARGSRPPGR